MSNRAWVTLATNDSYGLGALVLAHSLRRVGSRFPAVVLLTPAVTEAMRDRLRGVFAEVVLVDVLDSRDAAHLALLQRPELGITFTKIHCWTLTQYEKCVFLDADTLVVQNCDELFDREELSAAPDVGWPDCFNSGVFVYKPSNETFEALVRFAQERGSFDGGDQGLLNSFFSDWARGDPNKRLPFIYNVTSAAFYSYIPALKQFGQDMKIIHFIGANKPWLQTFNWETRSVSAPDHLRELLQLWWDLFVSQVHSHLDTTMENAPQDVPLDRAQYYEPQVDPDSQFPWHRPEKKVLQPNEHEKYVEKCLTEFYDPWENYRGNVPPKSDESSLEQRTVTVGRVEVSEETRNFAWEYKPHQTFETINHSWRQNQENAHDFSQQTQIFIDNVHHQVYHPYQETDSHQQYHSVHGSQNYQMYSQPILNDTLHNHRTQDCQFQSLEHVSHHQYNDSDQQHQDSFQHHEHYHSYYEQGHEQSHLQTDSALHHRSGHDIVKEFDFDCSTEYYHHNHSPYTQKFEEYQSDQSQNVYEYQHSQINHDQIKFHQNNSLPLEEHRKIENKEIEITQAFSVNGQNNECESDTNEPEIRPRHPYDYFWLRHKVTIDSRGRKICTHELPPTPPPSPPPEPPTRPVLDSSDEQSGVAGNLARVSPDNIGSQREALDELTRRQGWEAGNIDYMGADSFANIWAKISQTLSQPRSSPPKQATPPLTEPTPKQPTPPKDLQDSIPKETTQSEQTEKSAFTSVQQEADTSALGPVRDIIAQAISELEAASEIESKVVTESATAEAAQSEDKLESDVIQPKLESKMELDTKEETMVVEPEIKTKLKQDEMAQVIQSAPETEITGESVIPAETASKSTPELMSPAELKSEDVAKCDTVIVQSELTTTGAAVSEASTLEPLADIMSEKAVTDSTQVAQPTKESVLQPIEGVAEKLQQEAPVGSPANIPLSSAPAPEAPVLVSSTVETPVTAEVSATVETSIKADSALTELSATIETPATAGACATTEIPATTEASAVTKASATTDALATAEAPATTEVLTRTEAPVTAEATTTTEACVTTEAPATTEIPATTEAPAKTEAPAMTEPPATTEAPVTTEILATTEAPVEIPVATHTPTEIPVAKDTSVEVAKSIEGSTCTAPEAEKNLSTPDKTLELSKDSASDSPPLATTPAKEEQPLTAAKSGAGAEGDGERAARRPAQRLQLVPPATAAPLTPDSELEDAAALAQSIIASELATPTVTAPTPPLPTPASPPVPPVSLAQIGVKPSAKEKTTTAAHIASSVSETKDTGTPKKKSEKLASVQPEQPTVPVEPPAPSSPTETSEPATSEPKEAPVKKKVIKKVKKEGAAAETPVPPPRKKEKKPK